MMVLWSLLLLCLCALPTWAANTHTTRSEADERAMWFGDWQGPGIVTGCLPLLGAPSATLPATACRAYVRTSTGALAYVSQAAATVGPLSGGDGAYWLALQTHAAGTQAGWTRQAGTHYLWRKAVSQPADSANVLVLARLTVAAGVLTDVVGVQAQQVAVSLTLAGSVRSEGPWIWAKPGALVTVPAGATLTLAHCPEAGRWQIFNADETTTGAVRFLPEACDAIAPEWWGGPAIRDGVTDASPALQRAVNSLTDSAGQVRLVNGTYALPTTVTLPNALLTLSGTGWDTRLVGAADPLLAYPATLPTVNGQQQTVQDLAIETTADNTGIRIHQTWVALVQPGFVLQRLYVRNMSETTGVARGVSIRGVTTGIIRDSYFGSRPTYNHITHLGGTGIYLDVADATIATSVMNLLISNNFFVSLNAGIYAPARTLLDPDPGRIEGIQIANNMFAALNFAVSVYRSLATSVINNNISDVNVGVDFHGDFAAAITGNMITSCRVACVSYEAIAAFPASDTAITGNTLNPLHSPEGIGVVLNNTAVDNYLLNLTLTGNAVASPLANTGGGIIFAGDHTISGVTITGNAFKNLATGIGFTNSVPASEIVFSANTYTTVTTLVGNPANAGTLQAKSYAFTDVRDLTGGATTETVNITLPANTFAAKPDACFITSAVPTDSVLGWYDYGNAGTTATNIVVTLASNAEGSNLGAGAHRFNVACFGAGYLLR